MAGVSKVPKDYEYEPWYKYGVAFLFFEAALAIAVSIYALSMAFTGQAVEFKKKVTFEKPKATIEQPAPAREEPNSSTIDAPAKQ